MIRFDRSFLPPAQFEFAVIADTHYMLDVTAQPVEFESRRQQTARAEYAMWLVAALDTPLLVHMGDLVQEFPERPNFGQAVTEAMQQLNRIGLQPRFVAGNHDIGDKPDPTMPASWVTAEFLANYHARCGRSWYSWEEDDLHFVVLNSQIMNSGLPAAQAQMHWLEEDLRQHIHKRIFIFLHLPLFLHSEDEPALGHYDNVAEPARSWLLKLVRAYQVELVLAAHVHWSFYNQIGETAYFTVPSAVFTRPGFSELFSSPPPDEQGRNDVGKLGFFLVRVYERDTRIHFIRTGGKSGQPQNDSSSQQVLTRTTPDLPASPLGLVVHHPLSSEIEVPSVWPSTIRQPARNDYPMIACLELGVRHLRVPTTDLTHPLQQKQLAILRGQGVQIMASWLWHDQLDLVTEVAAIESDIDGIELQLPGTAWPNEECLIQMQSLSAACSLPITLSTVVPGQYKSGKQHARTQRGYRPADLVRLDHLLAQFNVRVERVLCRIDPDAGPWKAILEAREQRAPRNIGKFDWIFEASNRNSHRQCCQVAEALFASALMPQSRLFLEPFLDLDRTMDVGHGLLDRLCNPRPAFHVARVLNTLLFSQIRGNTEIMPVPQPPYGTVLGVKSDDMEYWMILPEDPEMGYILSFRDLDLGAKREGRLIDLVAATSCSVDEASADPALSIAGPTLIWLF